jgi:hypothetical protein
VRPFRLIGTERKEQDDCWKGKCVVLCVAVVAELLRSCRSCGLAALHGCCHTTLLGCSVPPGGPDLRLLHCLWLHARTQDFTSWAGTVFQSVAVLLSTAT